MALAVARSKDTSVSRSPTASPTRAYTHLDEIYRDTTLGSETETPVVYAFHTSDGVPPGVDGVMVMDYHQIVSPPDTTTSQITARAVSTDGVTWVRQGVLLDIPKAAEFPRATRVTHASSSVSVTPGIATD